MKLWQALFRPTVRISYALRELCERGTMKSGEFMELAHCAGLCKLFGDKPDRKYVITKQTDTSHYGGYRRVAWDWIGGDYIAALRNVMLSERHLSPSNQSERDAAHYHEMMSKEIWCMARTDDPGHYGRFLLTWVGPTMREICSGRESPRASHPRFPGVPLQPWAATDRGHAFGCMESLLAATTPPEPTTIDNRFTPGELADMRSKASHFVPQIHAHALRWIALLR